MAAVALAGVAKSFGKTVALRDVTFDVADGEFFCLLGPSGAGKTTTLKVVAGFERPDDGRVRLDGADVTVAEPGERNLAMCFESYALYPQLDVYGNLASPLRSPKFRLPDADTKARVGEVAELLGIGDLLDRSVNQLSNGQRQRVALGRVLVRPAAARLLDEPLAHLDAKLRATMRAELKSISEQRATTTLYVTHDYVEALALADRIGVLLGGRILQVGTPAELWREPRNAFVAGAFGKPRITLVPGKVDRFDDGPAFVAEDMGGGPEGQGGGNNAVVTVPLPVQDVDGAVQLGVRPRDLRLHTGAEDSPADVVSLPGSVYVVEYLGRQAEVTVRVGGTTLSVLASRASVDGMAIDDQVRVLVDPAKVFLFRAGTEGERVYPI